jgi:myo-inositol 2-dehydrogenase/D-chiro-inositol 1-dehydrogenase
MMGFNYRHNPLVQRARSAIGGGAVGTPVSVRTVFTTPSRTIPAWKQQRQSGGGALLDLAVHHVDLIRFLLGTEVAHVSADVLSTRSEHDTVTLQMRLTNGCLAQVMCSLGTIDDDRIEIHGSAGRLTIDRYRSLRVEVTPASASGMLGVAATRFAGEMRALPYALRKLRSPMHDPSFPAAISAFVHAVASRTPATPSFDDGLRALAVVEAAEESARSGRAIRLDSPVATVPRAHVAAV